MANSELELIELLKKGDENAFRTIIEDYQKIVLNCCYRFVKNPQTAEDLTQDVFIEVYRSIEHFKGKSKFSTWVYRIAVTKSIDFLRAQKRKKRFAFIQSITGDENMEEQIENNESLDPGKELEKQDRIKVLNRALESLSDNQKAAFTLSKYDELSYKEIAEILDTTVSAVESLIHRAKKNLEKKLYKYYEKIL